MTPMVSSSACGFNNETEIAKPTWRLVESGLLFSCNLAGLLFHVIQPMYIKKKKPKSILCMPLLNRGEMSGILYLENNLITGAFTEQSLNLLTLLSSQAAISIQNARFYTHLKRVNQAYERFVPREFLQLLEKKSILDVELGQFIQEAERHE